MFCRVQFRRKQYERYKYFLDINKIVRFILFIGIFLNYITNNNYFTLIVLVVINSSLDIFNNIKFFNKKEDVSNYLYETLCTLEKCRDYLLNNYKNNNEEYRIRFQISTYKCIYYRNKKNNKKINSALDSITSLITEDKKKKIYTDKDMLCDEILNVLNEICKCTHRI